MRHRGHRLGIGLSSAPIDAAAAPVLSSNRNPGARYAILLY
jgi:hypothetical protein